jgi:hypothetical protein
LSSNTITRRTQEDCVDQAEDSGAAADADCQRENRRGREARAPRQRSGAVAGIASKIFRPDERASVALELLRLVDPAKPFPRCGMGFIRRQPAAPELVLQHREVCGNLAVEVSFGAIG